MGHFCDNTEAQQRRDQNADLRARLVDLLMESPTGEITHLVAAKLLGVTAVKIAHLISASSATLVTRVRPGEPAAVELVPSLHARRQFKEIA